MSKTRKLNEYEKGVIITRHKYNLSQRKISQNVKRFRSALQITLKHFRFTKNVKQYKDLVRKKYCIS